MSDPDKEIEALEASFPALSGQAFAAERRKTLEAGYSVLQAVEGIIYEVFPDGQRKVVKQIERPVPTRPGTRLRLR
jgi:hypothetical protein